MGSLMTKEEIAKLIGKSPATVFRRAKKEKWQVIEQIEKGVKKHYYPLEYLIETGIIKNKEKDGIVEKDIKKEEIEGETKEEKEIDEIPKWNQELALGRFYICKQIEKFIEETGIRKLEGIKHYTKNFNNFEILKMIKKEKLAANTVYKWYKKYEENRNNPAALASEYGKSKGNTLLTEEEQEFIKRLYFSANKVTVMYVYERYYAKYGKKAKSYHVVLNYINRVPKVVKDKYRMGKKEFHDKYEPFVLRDNHDIKANEVWVSDGHDLEIMVKLKGTDEKGKQRIVTPKWIVWQDMKTKVIVGWSISLSENTEAIIDALKMGIKRYGKPKIVFTDNGKAYKSGLLKGDEEAKLEGIYSRLGLEVCHALPYNAQSKPVERYFRDFKETFAKEFNSYKGGNITERPEILKEVLKTGDIIEYERLYEAINKFVEYKNGMYYEIRGGHRGRGVNGVPIKLMNKENPPEKREKITDAELRILLHHEQKRTIRQEGIELFGNLYHSADMYQYINEKVIVRYDPDDLKELYVYDEENKYIFRVESRTMTGFKDVTGIKEVNKLKKIQKKHLKKADNAQKQLNEKDPSLLILTANETEKYKDIEEKQEEELIINENKIEKRREEKEIVIFDDWG